MSRVESGNSPDQVKRVYRQAEDIVLRLGVLDETGRAEFRGLHGDEDYSIILVPGTGKEKRPGLNHGGSVFVQGPDTDKSASMMLLHQGNHGSRRTEVVPLTPIPEAMPQVLADLRPNSEEMRRLKEQAQRDQKPN